MRWWRRWWKFDAAIRDIGTHHYDQERRTGREPIGRALDRRFREFTERHADRRDRDANDKRERSNDV